MENKEEIFKQIEGFPDYEVSNLGNVKTNTSQGKGKLLKKRFTKCGYYRVALYNNNKVKHLAIHRLVAKAFIENPENKPYINHINSKPHDNRVVNLEWCTPKENVIHGIKYGNINHVGENNNFAKLKNEEVLQIIDFLKQGLTPTNILKQVNTSLGVISDIKRGARWTHLTKNVIFPKCDKGRFSIEQRLEILNYYKNNSESSSRKISKLFDISYATVRRIIKNQK